MVMKIRNSLNIFFKKNDEKNPFKCTYGGFCDVDICRIKLEHG